MNSYNYRRTVYRNLGIQPLDSMTSMLFITKMVPMVSVSKYDLHLN